jgi:hypothetical protein
MAMGSIPASTSSDGRAMLRIADGVSKCGSEQDQR